MIRVLVLVALGVAGLLSMGEVSSPSWAQELGELKGQESYADAMKLARQHRRMMVVYFAGDQSSPAEQRLQQLLAQDSPVRRMLAHCVLVRIPQHAEVSVEGRTIRLLEHAAFGEMQGEAGLALIDFRYPGTRYYGYVVSVYPFSEAGSNVDHELYVLLDLPPGTLTQRTLVFAVRTHPEAPQSALGPPDPILSTASEQHSDYQANLLVQGHHNWDQRFHSINSQLPPGLTAQEVCAESWPGQRLLAAAREIVRSWRHSPGHWGAVRGRHRRFGYDMKRGANGVWYGTGIFAR